jgi:hypothetical protein
VWIQTRPKKTDFKIDKNAHVVRYYGMLKKNPEEYERDTSSAKMTQSFLVKFLLLLCSLVDE